MARAESSCTRTAFHAAENGSWDNPGFSSRRISGKDEENEKPFPVSRLCQQAERLVPRGLTSTSVVNGVFPQRGRKLESPIRAWLLRQTDFAHEFGKPGIRTQRVELEVGVQTH